MGHPVNPHLIRLHRTSRRRQLDRILHVLILRAAVRIGGAGEVDAGGDDDEETDLSLSAGSSKAQSLHLKSMDDGVFV